MHMYIDLVGVKRRYGPQVAKTHIKERAKEAWLKLKPRAIYLQEGNNLLGIVTSVKGKVRLKTITGEDCVLI